jgi:hypothetical protein
MAAAVPTKMNIEKVSIATEDEMKTADDELCPGVG